MVSCALIHHTGMTRVFAPTDSAQKIKFERRSNAKLAVRLHSMGQFAYGGRIVSENPVADFNFNYDRKNWGFQFFKAMGLRDRSTEINFSLAVVNKNFHLGKRLTITPSAGFLLEQSKSVADHGSDVLLIVTSTYKLSKGFTVDYSTLFGNLVLEPEAKDWINRVRMIFSKKHLDLTTTIWHNNKVFDSSEYVTCAASSFLSRMKVSKTLTLSTGITGLIMPYSSNTDVYPKKNGVIFTLMVILD